MAATMSLCPGSANRTFPAVASQRITEPSLLPEASVLPSGANARQVMVPLCALKVAVDCPCAAALAVTSISSDPGSIPTDFLRIVLTRGGTLEVQYIKA